MTQRNWPELIAVMQYILDNPEKWNQRVYSNTCGTAYCFAGHAAMRTGARQLRLSEVGFPAYCAPIFPLSNSYSDLVTIPEALKARAGEFAAVRPWRDQRVRTKGGEPVFRMDDIAEVVLGLATDEADALFDGENTIANLVWSLNNWAREDGVTLPDSWPAPKRPERFDDYDAEYDYAR